MGFRFYGRLLERVFGLDPRRATPACRFRDDLDYVPARSWWVLFGHHFSSICGAGPIVGPALAIAYWGWGASLLWILLGTVFLGAVSDFSALMVSLRHRGKSVSEISGGAIGARARLLFSVFIWLSLILVLAVFVDLTAQTFVHKPQIVLPSWGLMPVALGVGILLHRRRWGLIPVTSLGLFLLAGLLVGGQWLPVALSPKIWILLLLGYCYAAAVLPVHILLQPRDYLASYLLFGTVALGILGAVFFRLPMQGEFLHSWQPFGELGSGPLWPMLFVTIACGAISGFHTLVSSGTTSKQIASEAHACRIGYGGMLMEGLVGVLVVVSVGAGLSTGRHMEILKGGGAVAAFGEGFGNLVSRVAGGYGELFAVLALNTFILTTLDTAARVGRYVLEEVAGISNRYLSTGVVVLAAAALALPGHWARIWAVFGTSNQLIAGLSLLLVSVWLASQRRPVWYTLAPAGFMLLTTLASFGYQIYTYLNRPQPDWLLTAISLVLSGLALAFLWDCLKKLLPSGGLPTAGLSRD